MLIVRKTKLLNEHVLRLLGTVSGIQQPRSRRSPALPALEPQDSFDMLCHWVCDPGFVGSTGSDISAGLACCQDVPKADPRE